MATICASTTDLCDSDKPCFFDIWVTLKLVYDMALNTIRDLLVAKGRIRVTQSPLSDADSQASVPGRSGEDIL